MPTASVTYKGNLRTSCLHLKSGNHIITDAPTDNKGKGEAFSPTDTVATGLASCMMTIMGIKADSLSIDITGASATVTKTMAADPRRISKITVHFNMPSGIDKKAQTQLERAAITCPVHYSLHPDIEKEIYFTW
jgi:uncharacterized OsmC-like protein